MNMLKKFKWVPITFLTALFFLWQLTLAIKTGNAAQGDGSYHFLHAYSRFQWNLGPIWKDPMGFSRWLSETIKFYPTWLLLYLNISNIATLFLFQSLWLYIFPILLTGALSLHAYKTKQYYWFLTILLPFVFYGLRAQSFIDSEVHFSIPIFIGITYGIANWNRLSLPIKWILILAIPLQSGLHELSFIFVIAQLLILVTGLGIFLKKSIMGYITLSSLVITTLYTSFNFNNNLQKIPTRYDFFNGELTSKASFQSLSIATSVVFILLLLVNQHTIKNRSIEKILYVFIVLGMLFGVIRNLNSEVTNWPGYLLRNNFMLLTIVFLYLTYVSQYLFKIKLFLSSGLLGILIVGLLSSSIIRVNEIYAWDHCWKQLETSALHAEDRIFEGEKFNEVNNSCTWGWLTSGTYLIRNQISGESLRYFPLTQNPTYADKGFPTFTPEVSEKGQINLRRDVFLNIKDIRIDSSLLSEIPIAR